MAKDTWHDAVRRALEKDGWKVTHEQFKFNSGDAQFEIDLLAEKLIVAEYYFINWLHGLYFPILFIIVENCFNYLKCIRCIPECAWVYFFPVFYTFNELIQLGSKFVSPHIKWNRFEYIGNVTGIPSLVEIIIRQFIF